MKMKTKISLISFFFAVLVLFAVILSISPISVGDVTEEYVKNQCSEEEIKFEEALTQEENFVFSLTSAEVASSYIIEMRSSGYVATIGESEISNSDLGALIAEIEDDGGVLSFNAVEYSGSITLTKSVTLTGDLSMSCGNLNLYGGTVTLSDINLFIDGGSVKVKSGKCLAESGIVRTYSKSAFVLDGVSSSSLVASGAEIYADATGAAVLCSMGSVVVTSGKIINDYGPAIENYGTLYLSGEPIISGFSFDTVTDNPIYLSYKENPFLSNISVMYKSQFLNGSFTVVCHNASKESIERISLFDVCGDRIDITYFASSEYSDEKNVIAVIKTNRVKFYVGNLLLSTDKFLSGEAVNAPASPTKDGYSFIGWYKDTAFSEPYIFGEPECSDFSLYAKFTLTPPEFVISSKAFVYDGEIHTLTFDKISHPLANNGDFSFVWYKNSLPLSNSSSSLNLINVSDSGEYFCKLTFAYCGDFVTVETPKITVDIDKRSVEKPAGVSEYYTGNPIYPSVEESVLYISNGFPETNVGQYPVTLTLTDFDNYKWSDSESEITTVTFEILQAENLFLTSPLVDKTYEGGEIKVSVSVKFGEPKILYSVDGENWAESAPSAPGNYYLKAEVEETENYTALSSGAIAFEILKEICIGIKIDKYPDKTEYRAFEKLVLDGAEFTVTYNSGRSEKIDNSLVTACYSGGEYFLVSDSSVSIIYGEASVPLAVKISLAQYDISSVIFEDTSCVYDGKRHTISPRFDITGIDGIPLTYKVTGGGINAGVYDVTLTFYTESINYAPPSPITKSLRISPMPLNVEYGNTEFVYDGNAKIPTATIVNAQGLPISLTLSGAATDAGVYVARAILSDSNYTLNNTSVEFKILKADLDFSTLKWSGDSFVYNGEEQTVSVTGLPSAVTLVGYADSTFSEVGEYVTEITISYDEKNYNTPDKITHKWRIIPADYVFSDFGFVDSEFIYDGLEHYPNSFGSIPKGLDGSSPTYRFSSSVTHVSEGRVKVTVSFTSGSKNYNTPADIEVFVRILPKRVNVIWSAVGFVYDGNEHLPIAESNDCEIEIFGAATDAGEYVAEAVSKNTDYEIINSKIVYTIAKAENEWLKALTVPTCYEGREPEPYAKAKSGVPEFRYFSDKELKNPISAPKNKGVYYVIGYVSESKNYLSLSSAPVELSILEILPISLNVDFSGITPIATMDIRSQNIKAYYLNNDGSVTPIEISELSVTYENGELLSAKDKKIIFSYGDFSAEYEISVSKMPVELPEIPFTVYSGEAKMPAFAESPLYKTDFSAVRDSGIYTVRFYLTDPENYEFKGGICERRFEIKKAPLTLEVTKKGDGYEIVSGEIFGLDELYEEYYTDNGYVYIRVENPNYEVSVIPSESREGARYVWIVFLIALLLVLLALLSYIIVTERMRIIAFAGLAREKFTAIIKKNPDEKTAPTEEISKSTEEDVQLETLLAVDELHANNLISDSLAKNLVTESEISVETNGKRRAIVNLDTISEAFSAGDKVDINDMKIKGIVPEDAKSVKVLARGIIDKPIHILANSFSLSAVKMIALTGGSAKRVHTSRKKTDNLS